MNLYIHLEESTTQKEWYSKTLKQYEDDDVIERVEDKAPGSVGVYYIPHSGVWKPHKQKALRVVFVASSKRKGQLSLNDNTYKGESLVNNIRDVLIASRTCKIILRIPFGAKPSPSILNRCLLSFLQCKDNDLAKDIDEKLYVDNILLSADTPSEALKKYHESKALPAEIGMNPREYVSNSNEVNSAIPVYGAPSGTIKLLRVTYNTESDEFTLELKFPDNKNLTKSDVLSQLNSIYDPLGVAAPLTIHLKHIMRKIHDRTIEWKEPVSKDLADIWKDTGSKLNSISLSVPRFSFEDNIDSFTIWVFSDASTQALAVCAYFRNEHTA
ncbi:unnamed protein product [Haemonchus placei]|uniref:UBX domain-containing protein n=1 Tax=Haemonchus placei TaxID=6290 RepID=A0A0N4WHC1_HAEPC|nr:unnamed protein product [Haemonchus placei]